MVHHRDQTDLERTPHSGATLSTKSHHVTAQPPRHISLLGHTLLKVSWEVAMGKDSLKL